MTIAVLPDQQDSNDRASLLRCADLQHESKDNFLYIDPSKLVLSENGSHSWSEVSYGMHCLHHSEGSVESVIVSPLCCHDSGQTYDEDVFEDVRVRTKALWKSPHRCVTPPVGVSSCTSPSGSSVLLYVEQMRSSSSLQHMVLQQMERPQQQLYSMKQALDWLIQLASALAHLHNLQPEMPHGRLSTSVVAVTSAAEVSLGRCISTFGCRDGGPDSKRLHVLGSRKGSGNSDIATDALVPDSVKPIRTLPRYPLGCRRNSAGVTLAFPLSLGSSESLRSAHHTEVHGMESPHVEECLSESPSTHGSTAWTVEDTPGINDVFRRMRLDDISSPDPVVSSSKLPGVGTVFKVSGQRLSRNSSGKESLYMAAEAAVWSRSDAGSEVKQHGGAFFARNVVEPHLQRHSMPLESTFKLQPQGPEEVTMRGSRSQLFRCLDAADTEHVLLDSPLMWMRQDSAEDQMPPPLGDPTKHRPNLNVHLNVGGTVFSRAVARAPLLESSLARDRPSNHGRWSDDGISGSPVSERACAKRSRSGLSVRLPSLVELPGTEERYAVGTQSAHAGSRPMSVPPASVDGMAAARSGHAGLSHYSMSSPGGSYLGTAVGEAQKNESCSEAERLAHSVSRLKFATSALTRIRQTVMSASMRASDGGTGDGVFEQGKGQCVAGVESPRLDNRRQRGSQKVLLLLESNQESMRTRWRRLMTRQSRVSNVESLPPPDVQPSQSPLGIYGDDIPYLAPEILEGGEPSAAGDCFAFGIIMYEVLSRELVAGEIAMHADLEHVSDEEALKWHSSRVVEGERPHVPLSWPAEVRDIIQLCWQDDALNRPTLASIQTTLESCSM